jgi:uncharacterized OsmC-like protein
MLEVTVAPKGAPHIHTITARHHTFETDVDSSYNGADTAAGPHEVFLGGLGACTAITMAHYAASKGWAVTFKVKVTEDKIDDPDDTSTGKKKQIPHIVELVTIEGDLTDEQLEKLRSIGKKCPVYLVLTGKKVVDLKVERASA